MQQSLPAKKPANGKLLWRWLKRWLKSAWSPVWWALTSTLHSFRQQIQKVFQWLWSLKSSDLLGPTRTHCSPGIAGFLFSYVLTVNCYTEALKRALKRLLHFWRFSMFLPGWSSVVSALENAKNWQLALAVNLEYMKNTLLKNMMKNILDVFSCQSSVKTDMQKWHLWFPDPRLESMQCLSVLPNTLTINAAISSCEKCSKWQNALQLFYSSHDEKSKCVYICDICGAFLCLRPVTTRHCELWDLYSLIPERSWERDCTVYTGEFEKTSKNDNRSADSQPWWERVRRGAR